MNEADKAKLKHDKDREVMEILCNSIDGGLSGYFIVPDFASVHVDIRAPSFS